MQCLTRWLSMLALAATVGCATTLDTGSFVDRGANFSRYHTYNWAAPPRLDGDPRLQRDAFFKDHFEGEVEKQLAAKGFAGPKGRRPDLLVRYRAAVTPRMELAGGADSSYGYCSFDCVDRVKEYETATLVLDVIDARTRRIVWRGWARDDLRDVVDHQDRMERTIHQAVVEMMAKLPTNS